MIMFKKWWASTVTMMARAVLVALLEVAALNFAAAQQCPPGTKIYIDPRLVPQRTRHSFESAVRVGASQFLSDAAKRRFEEEYANQNKPIQMQYGNGYVLIAPHDPCIQQYIPTSSN